MSATQKSSFPGVTRRERQMAMDITNQLGLPLIRGKWFWLDPENGDDDNNGLRYNQAVAGLKAAYALCTSGRGDGIVILSAGTTVTTTTTLLAAAIDWSKHGITVVGVDSKNRMYQRARVSNVVATLTLPTLINLSGNNNRFLNTSFINEGTDETALGCIAITGARNTFDNCHIFGGWCTTQTANERSLELGSGAQDNYFKDCTIGSDTIDRGNNANCELYINGTTSDGRNFFENCRFTSAASTAGGAHLAVKSAGSSAMGRNTIFKDCIFDCFVENKGAGQAFAFGGTMPTSGHFIIANTATLAGYAAWETGTTGVMVSMAAGSATGGLVAGG